MPSKELCSEASLLPSRPLVTAVAEDRWAAVSTWPGHSLEGSMARSKHIVVAGIRGQEILHSLSLTMAMRGLGNRGALVALHAPRS